MYIDAFRRLGAIVRVIDPIPRTVYTANIPGGSETFWGYALNKLAIFNMTEFDRVVFVDADSLVLRNIDHLASATPFAASSTFVCCNPQLSPAYINGGLWVAKPDVAVGTFFWQLMCEGWPRV